MVSHFNSLSYHPNDELVDADSGTVGTANGTNFHAALLRLEMARVLQVKTQIGAQRTQT